MMDEVEMLWKKLDQTFIDSKLELILVRPRECIESKGERQNY